MIELLEQGKGWDVQKVLKEALESVKQIPGV